MPVVLFENNLFKLMAHIETTMQLTLNCHSIQIENTVKLTFKVQFSSDWSYGFNIEPYSHKATIQKDLEISPQSDSAAKPWDELQSSETTPDQPLNRPGLLQRCIVTK